jgi:hypothetical protein
VFFEWVTLTEHKRIISQRAPKNATQPGSFELIIYNRSWRIDPDVFCFPSTRYDFGGFLEVVAIGLQIRDDHDSQFMCDHFPRGIRFHGMESSPAFARQPEGDGWIERILRTLKEWLLWVRRFRDIEEPQRALREFRVRYRRAWLIEHLKFQSPQQARERSLALQQAA